MLQVRARLATMLLILHLACARCNYVKEISSVELSELSFFKLIFNVFLMPACKIYFFTYRFLRLGSRSFLLNACGSEEAFGHFGFKLQLANFFFHHGFFANSSAKWCRHELGFGDVGPGEPATWASGAFASWTGQSPRNIAEDVLRPSDHRPWLVQWACDVAWRRWRLEFWHLENCWLVQWAFDAWERKQLHVSGLLILFFFARHEEPEIPKGMRRE